MARLLNGSTGRRSNASGGRGWRSNSLVLTSSTANGCGATGAESTLVINCAVPGTRSPRWAPKRSRRASRELLATGETARKRTAETRDELTAQETQIAQFARDGLSNAEIGARLFISPRTVEYHLHKVFAKLGISRREHLGRALSGD
jgi:DNA-binding NarL/FixJ family response regulator